MRRAKFVELTSAYLDGEISEREKKLLEKEIRKDPERRALFASYKHLNSLVARASFPLEGARERRKGAVCSYMVWCVSGACAGLVVALALLRLTAPAVASCHEANAPVATFKPFEPQGGTIASLTARDALEALEPTEESLRLDSYAPNGTSATPFKATALILASNYPQTPSALSIRNR